MDDLSELTESKSYWCTKLIDTIEPCIFKKFKQIFDETWLICNETKETLLYLKAFQNALSCIPEWSNTLIKKECNQIIEMSKCDHLKELIATVHVVQLKIVANIRPNSKQHSVRLTVPDTEVFVHNVYINVARELWRATFLFSREVDLVKQQEHNYEIHKLIRSVIYKTIQDHIPTDTVVRSYLAEDVEEDEEVIIEPIDTPGVEADGSTSPYVPTPYNPPQESSSAGLTPTSFFEPGRGFTPGTPSLSVQTPSLSGPNSSLSGPNSSLSGPPPYISGPNSSISVSSTPTPGDISLSNVLEISQLGNGNIVPPPPPPMPSLGTRDEGTAGLAPDQADFSLKWKDDIQAPSPTTVVQPSSNPAASNLFELDIETL